MPHSVSYTGSLLARACWYLGLLQCELATLLGVSNALVHQLEAGRRTLTPAIAARLAPFLAPVPDAATAAQLLADTHTQADTSPPPSTPAPSKSAAIAAVTAHKAILP